VVTGGARGIGRGIAIGLAQEGAAVTVLDTAGQADFEGNVAQQPPIGIAYIRADVADPEAVEDAFRTIRAQSGDVDILVNNAGVVSEFRVAEMPIDEWDRVISVNLRGPFLCIRQVIAPMVEQRWGRIINVSSQLGQIGAETMAHYSASKAGLIGLTKSLAREVSADNVLVNAIAPGPIETAMLESESAEWRQSKLQALPIGRFGRIEEVVPTAIFLASEDASYYTGQTLGPNGGDVTL
jgi:NAD(P)-dependent dehydrogenase (short-subunit alcohol dehydrogenase family)